MLTPFTFRIMGGPAECKLVAPSSTKADEHFAVVQEECARIEAKYSRYRADSVVSRINTTAGACSMEVDEETAALLNFADELYRQSEGLFDVTSGVLRRAWNFSSGKVPSEAQLAELRPLIGWQKVEWSAPSIRLLPGMEIDLGGIAKEYAIDRAIGLLVSGGVRCGLVNLAGDLRTIGSDPNGNPWQIAIAHPRKPGAVAATLSLQGMALATSGDYERYFEVDGVRYCHILNPLEGRPVCELQSVSVVAPSCLVAGSASTIAMLYGREKGKAYLEELGCTYLMIDQGGRAVAHDETLMPKDT